MKEEPVTLPLEATTLLDTARRAIDLVSFRLAVRAQDIERHAHTAVFIVSMLFAYCGNSEIVFQHIQQFIFICSK